MEARAKAGLFFVISPPLFPVGHLACLLCVTVLQQNLPSPLGKEEVWKPFPCFNIEVKKKATNFSFFGGWGRK
jgi:hypothetical protein